MTTVRERETLTGMDPAMKQRLEQAGRTYKEAPAELRAVILASGRAGDKPAEIHKTIGYVYTYDYVARLVREDRAKNPGLHAY